MLCVLHIHALEAGFVLARIGDPGGGVDAAAGKEGEIRREAGNEFDGLRPDEGLGVFPQAAAVPYTSTPSISDRMLAVFSPLVMTLRCWNPVSRRASWQTVLLASRNRVCPSWMKGSAFLAMMDFGIRFSFSRRVSGKSLALPSM